MARTDETPTPTPEGTPSIDRPATAAATATAPIPLTQLATAARLAAIVWAAMLVGATLVTIEIVSQGVRLPLDQLALALLLTVSPVAAAFALRDSRPRLALALTVVATLKILAFISTVTTVLLTMRAGSLVDDDLARIDAALGVNVVTWINWAQHWLMDYVLWAIYNTLVPQTLLLVCLLAWRYEAAAAWRFTLQMAIAGITTLVVYNYFPTIGPFPTPESAPTEAQRWYVDLFLSLRSGEDKTAYLFVLTGLVTFPSFHAAWAVVLTAAFARFRRWLAAIAILNVIVLFTAVTHGCHYVADILAGGGIGLMAIALGAAVAMLVGDAWPKRSLE